MRSLLTILALILSTLSVDAKRGAKPNPKTATFGDVEFIASPEECGIVLVKRSTAPHKLEKRRIYRIRYNPFKERDVQDVWIADMFIAGDTLWIRDELNRIYSMTMKTFSVSQRKDVSIDDLQKLKRKTAANKALLPTAGAALSPMLSVTLTRPPVSTLTPAPVVGIIRLSPEK